MSAWSAPSAPYVRPGQDAALAQLRSRGYRLVMAEQGGVWLVGQHGSQWFPNWQAAAQSVADGTGALAKLEERISR